MAIRREPQHYLFASIFGALSYQFFGAVGGLVGLLACVGVIIWLLERKHNPHFRASPLQGIGDGLWWAAVTMVTVGYGDKVPRTAAGRVVAMVWMFSSIFSLAFFAALLTSAFTADQLKHRIQGPQDLPGARIGAVSGTTGDELLAAQGLPFRRFPFVIQACKTLHRGEIETVVYDRAILGHIVKEFGWREIEILPQTLLRYNYAIAVPHGSLLREPINQALLRVLQQPAWEKTVERYFAADY
jgi:ABC-type amino acid transport substrate-binding protein